MISRIGRNTMPSDALWIATEGPRSFDGLRIGRQRSFVGDLPFTKLQGTVIHRDGVDGIVEQKAGRDIHSRREPLASFLDMQNVTHGPAGLLNGCLPVSLE